MAEPKGTQQKKKFEIEPPRRARCGACGKDMLRVDYTTRFEEHGIRRVTATCQDCGAINFWDEAI